MLTGFRSFLATLFVFAAAMGAVEAATVDNVRVWSGPEGTRVVFELSGAVEHRLFSLAGPERVVIDLPRSSARGALGIPEPKGVVNTIRAAARPEGELRVVLELNGAAQAKSFLLTPNEQYGHRLVVDLTPDRAASAARRTPAPAASPTPAPRAPTPAVAAAPVAAVVPAATATAPRLPTRGRDVVIAIDAGHGGDDPGALGRGGAREKDVVLAIARKLRDEVNDQPGMRAVMIRDGDYFVSHRKRMEVAHTAQADFFISIHADSYRDPDAKGATVYVLSEKGASDEAAKMLAERENASDLIGGVSLADKDQVLARVLLDLSQNAALSASTAAGQRLIRRMAAVTPMRRREVQQAPFLVLKSPDVPSVLVETAYISNPREEASLRSPRYQASLAEALRQGIVDYFTANPPEGSYFASHQASPAQREPVRHVIARGETLSGIAERYRVSSASIRRSNSLKNDTLRVGQVLTIPPG